MFNADKYFSVLGLTEDLDTTFRWESFNKSSFAINYTYVYFYALVYLGKITLITITKVSFHVPLHKQIITLQKFNIPISIDISIETHKFLCIRQNYVNSRYYLTFKSKF